MLQLLCFKINALSICWGTHVTLPIYHYSSVSLMNNSVCVIKYRTISLHTLVILFYWNGTVATQNPCPFLSTPGALGESKIEFFANILSDDTKFSSKYLIHLCVQMK